MNIATKITELPALTADLLQSNSCLVDNLFADLWKQMGMKALLNAGSRYFCESLFWASQPKQAAKT